MYEVKKFDHLLGTPGFSKESLQTHFKLYEGYVANSNKVLDLLGKAEPGSPEFSELKRRFGWEFDGMRLHEVHFASFGGQGSSLDESSSLARKIIEDFGSLEAWQADFRATAMMRGIGWAILYYDEPGNKLVNAWVNEHDAGHLAGAKPLLPLDVFEHAFLVDHGTNRGDYVDAFLKAINWEVVAARM